MSDFKERYPLCAQAGLYVDEHSPYRSQPFSYPYGDGAGVKTASTVFPADHWVKASQLEKLLSEAPVVYGYRHTGPAEDNPTGWYHEQSEGSEEWMEHTARLIMIEPIKQKSREERAMELLKKIVDEGWCGTIRRDDYEHAKQLLSEGESES